MRNPASRRRSAAAAIAALALLPMTACGSDEGASDDVYRIGLVHSSEGPFATNSETMRAGARYAAELINADGGVNGRDIELVEVDYRNDPQSLVTDIPKLVSEDQVFAIVAPVDSAGCEIACLVASDLKVPIVSAGAGRPGVLEPSRPWSFTMTAPDAANSIPVLSSVMEDEGVQTAAIIVDEANATTEAQSALYQEVFDATGVEVVSTTTYTSGDSSFTSQVTSMAAKKPDVVALAAGPADASRIAAEVGAQGLDTLLIGTGSLQAGGTDYINGAGEAAEGTITAAQFNPDNPDEPAAVFAGRGRKGQRPGLGVAELLLRLRHREPDGAVPRGERRDRWLG